MPLDRAVFARTLPQKGRLNFGPPLFPPLQSVHPEEGAHPGPSLCLAQASKLSAITSSLKFLSESIWNQNGSASANFPRRVTRRLLIKHLLTRVGMQKGGGEMAGKALQLFSPPPRDELAPQSTATAELMMSVKLMRLGFSPPPPPWPDSHQCTVQGGGRKRLRVPWQSWGIQELFLQSSFCLWIQYFPDENSV